MSDNTNPERRRSQRIALSLRVVFIVGRRVYRTSTEDISAGGLRLCHHLPRDYRHPDLTMVIQSPNGHKSIITYAAFVDEADQSRLRFVDMKQADRVELENWLQSQRP